MQLLCAVAGLALGLLLPRITVESTVSSVRVSEALVRDEPIVWRTFGFAIGVFVFSVTTALVIGDQTKVSVIVPATEVVAVLAALALIRSLQVKAFASIQLAPTLAAIAGQGRGILDDLYRRPCPADRRPAAPLPPRLRAVIWPNRQVTLQQLDLGRLLHAADGGVIVLLAAIGDTLQEGAPVAGLHGGDVADVADSAGAVRVVLAFRPGMTTCAPRWMTSSSPRPGRPWSCCGPGSCSPACSTRHHCRASRRSPGGSIASRALGRGTSR